MLLSELKKLKSQEKCLYLKSPEGLEQLHAWRLAGYNLGKISSMIGICNETLKQWRTLHPEIDNTLAPFGVVFLPPAYRILWGFIPYKRSRGDILCEYDTPEELWQSLFIRNYFASHSMTGDSYYKEFLKEINETGIYRLSNAVSVAYCNVDNAGIIKTIRKPILKP